MSISTPVPGVGNGCDPESVAGEDGRAVRAAGVRTTTDLDAPVDVEGGTVDVVPTEGLWNSTVLTGGPEGVTTSKILCTLDKYRCLVFGDASAPGKAISLDNSGVRC